MQRKEALNRFQHSIVIGCHEWLLNCVYQLLERMTSIPLTWPILHPCAGYEMNRCGQGLGLGWFHIPPSSKLVELLCFCFCPGKNGAGHPSHGTSRISIGCSPVHLNMLWRKKCCSHNIFFFNGAQNTFSIPSRDDLLSVDKNMLTYIILLLWAEC